MWGNGQAKDPWIRVVDGISELAGGNRDGEVQEVNLGTSYFNRELYGRVERIYKSEEFIDLVDGTGPHSQYVVDISPPEGNVGEEGVARLENFGLQLIHEYLENDGAQR